ncbi:hypothetical protein [Wielerella bovis]|uniref:hypothetical protein n=1 Tax=Wielerella bovis TaxID=2917790 RepID=UPI002018A158|nr:hypothetical protein [Wielerella bovis]ULJ66675.1 hypothetical protein MIS31_10570 [Wielerella bovis]
MTEPLKPPPIVIGVSGIDDSKMRGGNADEQLKVDWQKVFAYPPFQMFVRERGGKGDDAMLMVETWLYGRVPDEVWADYSAWFERKGYWAAENPDGSLK